MSTYDIESFMSLWDFLSKRFFYHLDQEHLQMCGYLKSDLIKYYLVHAVRTKNKDKVVQFFSSFSHEILAESGDTVPGNLRSWFVLPYMDEPEKDQEFSVYFSSRWSELLKITLHNFLSIVMSTAPPPKLLLLERWFRSEAQNEMRSQLKKSSTQIEVLISRLEKTEDRMLVLRDAVKDLISHVHKANVGGANKGSVGLFETDEEAEGKRVIAKELGQSVLRIAAECSKKSTAIKAMTPQQRLREIVGKDAAKLFFSDVQDNTLQPTQSTYVQIQSLNALRDEANNINVDLEELEATLLLQLQKWLKLLTT